MNARINASVTGLDHPGFADPVVGAQACFRAVLEAMAHPGRLLQVGDGLSPPAPLAPAAAAVLLTLVDADTPLWLDPEAHPAAKWIGFHCGAPLIEEPASARFAFACGLPSLDRFAEGTDGAPETAATVIVQLPALGTGSRYRLSGPGLRTPALLEATGLPAGFTRDWRARRARFPLGVDLILCAAATLCALPRSISIEAC